MDKDSVIFVCGSETMKGAAVVDELRAQGFWKIAGVGKDEPSLCDVEAMDAFFADHEPAFVFMAGGRSGGIQANRTYPVEFMRDNLLGTVNVLDCAHRHGVKRLAYLASSCCYPRLCDQPMREEYLFTGLLEPTNAPYSMAKLSGVQMCKAYRQQHGLDFFTVIPANIFGPGDNYSLDDSHVISALIRRMHEAKETGQETISVWGSGKARREFIYSNDLARAYIHVMIYYDGEGPVNLGSGEALSIAEMAEAIQKVTGFEGRLEYDTSKPDGMPEKVLDSSTLLGLGWKPSTPVSIALQKTYEAFLAEKHESPTMAPS